MGAQGDSDMNMNSDNRLPRFTPLTREQLAELGLGGIAYLRPVVLDGTPAVAIFGADGRQIGVAANALQAAAAVVEHEMVPVSVH